MLTWGVKYLKHFISGKMFISKELGLSDLLLYAQFLDEGIILQTDGSFIVAYSFIGQDCDNEITLDILSSQLNRALNLMHSGWMIHIDTIRYKVNMYLEKYNCIFSNKLSALIDQERQRFYKSKNLFDNSYIIVFTFRPNIDFINQSKNFFQQSSNNNELEQQLVIFKNKVLEVVDLLQPIKPVKLSSKELLNHLNYCLTHENINLNYPKRFNMPLNYLLASKDLIGGFETKIGDLFFKTVSIIGFPTDSYADILNQLNYLEFEYRFNTRFIFIDNFEGSQIISKISDLWYQKRHGVMDIAKLSLAIDSNIKVNKNSEANYLDAQNAQYVNEKGNMKFGYYSASVIIFDYDKLSLENKALAVKSLLQKLGFQSQIERHHALEVFLGSLPGYAYANIRKLLIHTCNLADFIPKTTVFSGNPYNSCSLYPENVPALIHATTKGNTPFRFSLHINDIGHTLIVGPTGSGKSSLLNFIVSQHFKYTNAQVFMFDKNHSSIPLCMGIGGEFFNLGYDSQAMFQPLANIDDNETFEFILQWLEELCILNGIKHFSDMHRNALRKALHLMKMEIPLERRRITTLQYLIHDDYQELANVLQAFSSEFINNSALKQQNGFISNLFDADNNKFIKKINKFMVFEMASIMQYGDKIVIPLLNYLIFEISKLIKDNYPTLIIFDESFFFFKHDLMRHKIIEWLKTMRKFNVAVIFATQELIDLFQYPELVSAIKMNCATKIFLPNKMSLTNEIIDLYLSMGLNKQQINLISEGVLSDYFYCSDLGFRQFNLKFEDSSLSHAFCCKTSVYDVSHAFKLWQMSNKNSVVFLELWQQYVVQTKKVS